MVFGLLRAPWKQKNHQAAAQDDHSVSNGRDIGQVQEKIFTLSCCERLEIDQDCPEASKITLSNLEVDSSWLYCMAGHRVLKGFHILLCDSGIRSNVLLPNFWTLDTVLSSVFGTKRSICQYLEGGRIPRRLTIVIDRVRQNFDLVRNMLGHEFAVRDLRIRIVASNLSRKEELTRELESLI